MQNAIEGKSSTVFVAIGISARKAVEASMDIAAMILKDVGKLPKDDFFSANGQLFGGCEDMDEKRYKVDFAFLEKDVLAVLLFGSGAKGQLTSRSDRDFCIVIPGLREIGEKRLLLKKIFVIFRILHVPVSDDVFNPRINLFTPSIRDTTQ